MVLKVIWFESLLLHLFAICFAIILFRYLLWYILSNFNRILFAYFYLAFAFYRVISILIPLKLVFKLLILFKYADIVLIFFIYWRAFLIRYLAIFDTVDGFMFILIIFNWCLACLTFVLFVWWPVYWILTALFVGWLVKGVY